MKTLVERLVQNEAVLKVAREAKPELFTDSDFRDKFNATTDQELVLEIRRLSAVYDLVKPDYINKDNFFGLLYMILSMFGVAAASSDKNVSLLGLWMMAISNEGFAKMMNAIYIMGCLTGMDYCSTYGVPENLDRFGEEK